jgi:hypothetical protein
MSNLARQKERLFGKTDDTDTRCLSIIVQRGNDWPALESLMQALRDDLDLPAPALSVDGQGLRLWLALAEPVAPEAGTAFLQALCQRYLADIPASRQQIASHCPPDLPPQVLIADERWTAFIDPTLGSLFQDDAWLDLAPRDEQQAELLARCTPISPAEWAHARQVLFAAPTTSTANESSPPPMPAVNPVETMKTTANYTDPRDFLRAVMNDSGVSLGWRIEAAKALLPYRGL